MTDERILLQGDVRADGSMIDLRVHCSQGLGSGVLLKMDLLVVNRWVTRGDEGLRIWILYMVEC